MLSFKILSFLALCLMSCYLKLVRSDAANATDFNYNKVLEAAKLYLNFKSQLAAATAGGLDSAKMVSQLLAKAAPALAALSAFFSLIQFSTQKESQEIRNGFNQMQEQFRLLNNKLDDFKIFMDYKHLVTDYRRDYVDIYTVSGYIKNLPDKKSKNSVRKWCESSLLNGQRIFNNFYLHVVGKDLLGSLYPAVFKMIKYNITELKQWNEKIISDAISASEVVQVCLGITKFPEQMKNQTATENQKKLLEMSIVMVEAQLKILSDFGDQAAEDTIELLSKHQGLKGVPQLLHQGLRQKYFWVSWLVKLYDAEIKGPDYHKARCGNCRFILEKHKRTVFIAWCDEKKKPKFYDEIMKRREIFTNGKCFACRSPIDYEWCIENWVAKVKTYTATMKQEYGPFFGNVSCKSNTQITNCTADNIRRHVSPYFPTFCLAFLGNIWAHDPASYVDIIAYIKEHVVSNGTQCLGYYGWASTVVDRIIDQSSIISHVQRAAHIIRRQYWLTFQSDAFTSSSGSCFVHLKNVCSYLNMYYDVVFAL